MEPSNNNPPCASHSTSNHNGNRSDNGDSLLRNEAGPIYTSSSSISQAAINRIIEDVTGQNGQVSIVSESEIPHIILPDVRLNGGPAGLPIPAGGGDNQEVAPRDSPPIVLVDPNEDR